ncbi:MAG: AAA family ATPase [Blautia sp.]|nr:AAA family ATPase [Blautia sp.]
MPELKNIGRIYDDFFGEGPSDEPVQEKEKGLPEDLLDDIEKIKNMALSDFDAITQAVSSTIVRDKDQQTKKTDTDTGDTIQNGVHAPETEEQPEHEATHDTAVQQKEPVPEKTAMQELEELIGLESIKDDVKELIALVKTQKLRSDQGMRAVPVSKHLVFSGNPGTGKTTVARILARLYKEIGALSKGQLVEVDRSGLVAGFVGQTAAKTQEKIAEAMGGILFIDEAYTLAKEGNDFGQEAIDTILKAMEDNRDDLVVIVAGYTELMKKFINSNPGLKSRFNKYFEFPDYTQEELIGIFELQCKKYDYRLDEEARRTVLSKIRQMEEQKGENFANARDVRNLFEVIITNQATRIARMTSPDPDQLRLITNADVLKDELPEMRADEPVPDPEEEIRTQEDDAPVIEVIPDLSE